VTVRIHIIAMNDTSAPHSLDITTQAVRALTLYSLAEFQSGHASTIRVSADGTSFCVADDGRGHAIDRTVAGSPYLQFIYTHLDYPFAAAEGSPVQLHGIGMSLLNALCSELSVTVQKTEVKLRMTYRNGHLCEEERLDLPTESTGNAVSGTINPTLQRVHTNAEYIEQWLVGVLASNPLLKLHFNGKELHAPQPSAA
jgi:DNA gyrase/topoisomerase IV subunit B